MSETVYNPIFDSEYEYTFNADFTEFAVMYTGLIDVWIGDGTEIQSTTDQSGVVHYSGGTAGFLYGKYSNGSIQSLGFVSDYEKAKEYFAEHGLSLNLTYDEWIEILKDVPVQAANAQLSAQASEQSNQDSEAWATGKRQGTDVSIDDETYHNNSKYYSEQSASSASESAGYANDSNQHALNASASEANALQSATDSASSAAESLSHANDSESYRALSEQWATGGSAGTPSATNNAMYYSQQAANSATNASASASNAASSASDSNSSATSSANSAAESHQYELNAEQWATGNTGATYSTGNSAKEQADRSAVWATGSSSGNGSPTNNAKYFAEAAEEEKLQSESWAKGTRNGSADNIRANASTDNAKAYAEDASDYASLSQSWAETDIGLPSGSKSAKSWAADSAESASSSSASANLASEKATLASTKAADAETSAGNAASSATNAASSETNAATSEYNAQQWSANANNSSLAASQFAQNASQSEANALSYKTAAESAKSSAETAQTKAETAISHYPRIANNRNWETWNVINEQWEDTGYKSMAQSSVQLRYTNSTSGTTIPSDPESWSSVPDPQSGRFLWSCVIYTWNNGSVDYFYNVGYIGANGNGSVDSVNGMAGDVILDGTNTYVDNSVQDKETLYHAITRIGSAITNQEIDALF